MWQGDDRRRYFRINDRIAMRYMRLREEGPMSPDLARLSLGARLGAVNSALQKSLAIVQDGDVRVAETLALLDRKLNLVLESLDLHVTSNATGLLLADVNLSASGLAFPSSQSMVNGERLLLDMVFYPESDHLKVMANVVGCEPTDQGFWIRADFDNLSETEQELLVQHVLRCQTRELRARREARERDDR
ncbi:MAG: PilZ domain-containing protein [Gammaproteobacteria bacterium]|nr:PilZ domain-containing protein [Gammaproteobacteria bacterium]